MVQDRHSALVPKSMRVREQDRSEKSDAPISDERECRLLAEVAVGNRNALEELYLSYHRRLARFLTRLTRRYEFAEEIINDTFWIVWKNAGQFRGDSLASTWIMGIAYRRALKTLRVAIRPEVGLDTIVGDVPALIIDSRADEELHDLLVRALERLPVEHRIVVELAYYLGHSCEEIAVIMDCPANTVKTRLFYARAKLRLLIPQIDGSNPEGRA